MANISTEIKLKHFPLFSGESVLSPVFSNHPELSLSVPLSLSALHSFVYRNNSVFLFVLLSLSFGDMRAAESVSYKPLRFVL